MSDCKRFDILCFEDGFFDPRFPFSDPQDFDEAAALGALKLWVVIVSSYVLCYTSINMFLFVVVVVPPFESAAAAVDFKAV